MKPILKLIEYGNCTEIQVYTDETRTELLDQIDVKCDVHTIMQLYNLFCALTGASKEGYIYTSMPAKLDFMPHGFEHTLRLDLEQGS